MPLDLSADGTSLATAALAPALEDDAAGVDDDVDAALELVLADELLLLLLLPHAAIAAALSSDSAASSGLHLITIRLLVKVDPSRGGSA